MLRIIQERHAVNNIIVKDSMHNIKLILLHVVYNGKIKIIIIIILIIIIIIIINIINNNFSFWIVNFFDLLHFFIFIFGWLCFFFSVCVCCVCFCFLVSLLFSSFNSVHRLNLHRRFSIQLYAQQSF